MVGRFATSTLPLMATLRQTAWAASLLHASDGTSAYDVAGSTPSNLGFTHLRLRTCPPGTGRPAVEKARTWPPSNSVERLQQRTQLGAESIALLAVLGTHGVDDEPEQGAALEALMGGVGEDPIALQQELLGGLQGCDAAPCEGGELGGEFTLLPGSGTVECGESGSYWTVLSN
jgi:hypothetical protein